MATRSLFVLLGLAAFSAGCSWSRFDDVTEKGPIEWLKKPDNMQTGFGVVLATGVQEGQQRLIVGGEHGTSPAAVFDPSGGETPNLSALDSRLCPKVAKDCFLSPAVAHVPTTRHGDDRLQAKDCVALGIGRANLEGDGVLFECLDGSSFSRPVLNARKYPDDVKFALDNQLEEPVSLATDRSQNPPVVVGAPKLSLAWYYEPDSDVPVRLTPPVAVGDLPPGFGTRVAAVRLADDEWLFAVTAQGGGELHLFRADGARPRYLGCLGGTPSFGRTLIAGLVPSPDTPEIGDDVPDLVVADQTSVFVFDGAKLAALPAVPADAEGYTCTLGALPEGALLSAFGCGSTPDTSECTSSDFGAALALGDIDGDGDNEVIVGAPQMTVRGEHGAGAVLLYDVDTLGDTALQDVRFLAQGEQGDALGGAVAAVPIGNRDVLVAGAVRSGKVGLFYCSSMVPGDKRGKRCE